MEQETMALFDLPYQWIFPIVFISMTVVIGYFFVKYVIFGGGKDEEEAPEVAELNEQAEEKATSEVRQSVEEKEQK